MAQFVWNTSQDIWIIEAKDREEAIRVAIGNRIKNGASLENALRWFKGDSIMEISGKISTEPYCGELMGLELEDECGYPL